VVTVCSIDPVKHGQSVLLCNSSQRHRRANRLQFTKVGKVFDEA